LAHVEETGTIAPEYFDKVSSDGSHGANGFPQTSTVADESDPVACLWSGEVHTVTLPQGLVVCQDQWRVMKWSVSTTAAAVQMAHRGAMGVRHMRLLSVGTLPVVIAAVS